MNEELKKALEALNVAVKAQKEAVELKVSKEDLATKTKEADEAFTKAMDEAKKVSADAVEALKSELAGRIDVVEKAITTETKGKSSENNEVITAYKKECDNYFRTGKAYDAEVVSKYHELLVSKAYDYLGEDNQKALVEQADKDAVTKGLIVVEKTLQVQVPEDGGILVNTDRKSSFSERLFETSNVRPAVDVMTVSGDSLEIVVDDEEGISGGWVGETETRSTTGTPQIGLVTIPVHEQYAQPIITQKMLDDSSIDIAGWLQRKTNDKLIRVENAAFITGNGIKKPDGMLNYGAWTGSTYKRNALRNVTIKNTSTSALLTWDWPTVYDMVTALSSNYIPRAQFRMDRVSWAGFMKMVDSTGQSLLSQGLIQDGTDKRLFGYPVGIWEDMPSAFSSSTLVEDLKAIMFGDFSSYQIVEKAGIRVLRDPYTTKGQVKFYTTKRVGGALTAYDRIVVGLTDLAT